MLWTLVILLIAGLIFGLPLLIKGQIEKELKALLGWPVAIERLSLNPFAGSAHIVGIDIGSVTTLKDFALNIKLWPLLDRHIHIQSLTASELALPIKIGDTGLSVAGYRLPQNASGEAETPPEQWRVSVDRLVLDSATLNVFYQGGLQQFLIQTLSLGPFDSKGIAATESRAGSIRG